MTAPPLRYRALQRIGLFTTLLLMGCRQAAPPAAPAMQAMPVQISPVVDTSVPATDTFVSTIKSRRSATMQPQVDGNLTRILVHSGEAVKAGQLLMTINPLKQQATVEQQQGTQSQKQAVLDYNRTEAPALSGRYYLALGVRPVRAGPA